MKENTMEKMIQIHPKDNVAVALTDLEAGSQVVLGERTVTLKENIARGHKMALRFLHPGEDVVKYGVSIGHVTEEVEPGQWLHTHNVKTNLSGESEYQYHPTQDRKSVV